MRNVSDAEQNIIDRMMHLLEERSVTYISTHDQAFAEYVNSLYTSLQTKRSELGGQRATA